MDDKRVISADEMSLKIRAAVDARTDDDFVIIVRTDALAVTGMDDTMSRCEKYVEAGADVLFVEAVRSRDEVEKVIRNFDVPLLFNFADKGKSPMIPVPELERLGFKIVIFPGSAMLTVCKIVTELMREIKERGTTERLAGNMASLDDLFETVGLSEMLALDAHYAAAAQRT